MTQKESKFNWYCRFRFKDSGVIQYLTEQNNCKTIDELCDYWVKEKPNLDLLAAVKR